MHSSRAFRALTLVLLALFAFGPLSPAKAPAATTSQDYLPTPRHLVAARRLHPCDNELSRSGRQ